MLCTFAVRLGQDGSYVLRVSERAVLGPSGTGGRHVNAYPAADDSLAEMGAFRFCPGVISAVARVMSDPEVQNSFINFADNV